jgi:hypothetical protein
VVIKLKQAMAGHQFHLGNSATFHALMIKRLLSGFVFID